MWTNNQAISTFKAELSAWGILCVAGRTSARERRGAFDAEFRPVRIFNPARRTAHRGYPLLLARKTVQTKPVSAGIAKA